MENITNTKYLVNRITKASILLLFVMASNANSQTLVELVQLAVSSHPQLRSSVAIRQSAFLDVESARWEFFPTPSVRLQTLSASSQDPSSFGDSYQATLGITQPLWSGGSLRSNLEFAETNLELSDIQILLTKQQLALEVVDAYSIWFSASLRVQALESGLTRHQLLIEQVQRRLDEGASSQTDLALAKARAGQVEVDLEGAKADEFVSRTNLSELAGVSIISTEIAESLSGTIAITSDFELALARNTQSLFARAKERSPDILMAAANVQLARDEEKLIDTQRRAEVNLRVERQYGNLTFPNSEPSNRVFIEYTSRFGAGLSGNSNVRAANRRIDSALADLQGQLRSLRTLLLSETETLRSSKRVLHALTQTQVATVDIYDSFDRQFLSGSRGWLDVLNSAREVTQTDIQLAEVRSILMRTTWRLSTFDAGVDALIGVSL